MRLASSERVDSIARGPANSILLPSTVHIQYKHPQPTLVTRKPISTVRSAKSEIASAQRFDLTAEHQSQEHDDTEHSLRGSGALREAGQSTSGERGRPLSYSGSVAGGKRNGNVQRSPDRVIGELERWPVKRELPMLHAGTGRDGRVAAPIKVEPAAASTMNDVSAIQRTVDVDGSHISTEPVTTPAIVQRDDEVAAPAGPSASNNQNATAQSAPAVDVDSMAREVYQILSRRLRVEHERARGWSG